MLDKTKWEYHPYPDHKANVVFQWPIGKDLPPETKINTIIIPVLNKVSLRHPDWTLVLRNGVQVVNSDSIATPAIRFTSCGVYKGNEYLGYFCDDYNGNIGIDSPRLNKARQRGNNTHTRIADKAIKIIDQNFGPKVVEELLEVAKASISATLGSATSNAQYAVDKFSRNMVPHLIEFALDNWDTMLPYLIPKLHNISDLPEYPKFRTKHLELKQMNNSVADGGAYLILVQGDTYTVQPTGTDPIATYSNDTLPDKFKLGLGMLKITEKSVVMPGVGVKVDDNTFFLMEPRT